MTQFTVHRIGVIRTPHKQADGTPIQSAFAKGIEGVVEVFEPYAAGLKDLEGFDGIWLIYWFDRSADWKPLVKPYMDTQQRGVFATRAPARPNPIGLSSVKLEGIEGNTLYIRDADMLDGTPLLDIKPYSPMFDHFDVSRSGWMDHVKDARKIADERFQK